MKHVVASLTIGACLLVSLAGVVFAADPHGSAAGLNVTTGQPGTQPGGAPGAGASCGDLSGGAPPGQLGGGLSSMSPFALDAAGLSKNYAGSTTPLVNPGNSSSNLHANSQYDVACFHHMP